MRALVTKRLPPPPSFLMAPLASPPINVSARCRRLLAGDVAGLLPHPEQEPQTAGEVGHSRHAQQEEAGTVRTSVSGGDGPARQPGPGKYFVLGVISFSVVVSNQW